MFTTILENKTSEIVEKKSKFIANIYYIESKEEAEQKIKEVKKTYFDARHNCSAYRILENDIVIEKASDDGEPSGTAGGPMLNILQKNNLCNILVIVTRYFGGILLGTGGLVRAYSEATMRALEDAEKITITIGKELKVKLEYSNLEQFKYYCKKNSINITKTEYFNEIVCNIELEAKDLEKFVDDVEKRNISVLEYEKMGEKYIKIK